MLETGPVTLRLADGDDGPALRRLAQLDSRPPSPGPHLVAEREGRIDAALSLSRGDLVADPFRRTAELGELLRRHAAGPAPGRRPRRVGRGVVLEGAWAKA
jgi:hypothetical protein